MLRTIAAGRGLLRASWSLSRRAVAPAVARSLPAIVRFASSKQSNFEVGQQLCAASFQGKLAEVKRLVGHGADINQGDYDKRTGLHLAASEGHKDVVKYLLEKGANVNVEDRWGNTPLKDAIAAKHTEIVQLLRQKGGSVSQTEMGVSLCRAAAEGDIAEVRYLVESGADVNLGDYDKRTPLHIAAANGRSEMIQMLLDLGAKPDQADRFGNYPIMEAARLNNQACVELLMRGVKADATPAAKVELVSEFQDHMNETLQHFQKESIYRTAVVQEEVDFFYNKLKLHGFYFKRFTPAETANHIQCYMAAKKLAQAANRRQDIELATTSATGGFFLCTAEGDEMLKTEKKAEELVAKINAETPGKLTSMVHFLSRGVAVPYGSKKLAMYTVDTADAPKDVTEKDDDINKVASSEFLHTRSEMVRQRYGQLCKEATHRLSPVLMVYPEYHDQTIPILVCFRTETLNVSISDVEELLQSRQMTCERKMWETLANGLTVYSFYVHKREDWAISEFVKQMGLLFCIPRSNTLSTLFFQGHIGAREYAYAVSVRKFVFYFISQASEDYNTLLDHLEKDRPNRSRLISLGRKMKRDTISENRIAETFRKYPSILQDLFKDFQAVANPTDGRRVPDSERNKLRTRINTEVDHELDQAILNHCITFNSCLLKTNFYKSVKSALSFRLTPDFLAADRYYPETPYAVFFVVGSDFHGFHVRFSDIARGGIRVVKSRDNATFDKNNMEAFQEGYNLAHTQNFKNKDIPEFGSKGVVLLGRNYQQATRFAFRKYISALLDLLISNPAEVRDHLGREEILFLGPDENTADLMEWACLYAQKRAYPHWKSFTTGKPPTLGGIPHDEYGMTTRSVHKYVTCTLDAKGVREEDCTKLQTGGPDGDLGSNEILLSKDVTIGVVDGSGVLYDPKGLNREELTRLAKKRSVISHFDRTKLSPAGFVVLVEDRNVSIPTIAGGTEVVESGLTFRNDFHLNPLSSADLFVPCGGRPEAVNARNVHRMFHKDGVTPRFKYIVEGANLFLTNEARIKLEKAGVILFKDASTNKGGVTSSSLEVLAALTLTDKEFQENMCVRDGVVPAFYKQYVATVQRIVEENAEREWACIWREHAATGQYRTDITNSVSHKINVLNHAIHQSTLWDKKSLRDKVLMNAIPDCLIDLVGGLDVALQRIPEAYARAIFCATLASQYIYNYGLASSEFTFFEFIDGTFNEAHHATLSPAQAIITAEAKKRADAAAAAQQQQPAGVPLPAKV